jgi:hypothetical protein
MKQTRHAQVRFWRVTLLLAAVLMLAVVLAGCSQGGGVERFAGTYAGDYSGSGARTVTGTATWDVDKQGGINGTFKEQIFSSASIFGTVTADGTVTFTAPGGVEATGKAAGDKMSGTWEQNGGATKGTWSVTKQKK